MKDTVEHEGEDERFSDQCKGLKRLQCHGLVKMRKEEKEIFWFQIEELYCIE